MTLESQQSIVHKTSQNNSINKVNLFITDSRVKSCIEKQNIYHDLSNRLVFKENQLRKTRMYTYKTKVLTK